MGRVRLAVPWDRAPSPHRSGSAGKGSRPALTARLTPVGISTDDGVHHVARHARAPLRRGLHVSGDGHAEVGGDQAGHNSAEGLGVMFAERCGEEDRDVYLEGFGGQAAVEGATPPLYMRPGGRRGRSGGLNVLDLGSKSGNIGTYSAVTGESCATWPSRTKGMQGSATWQIYPARKGSNSGGCH